MGLSFSNNSVSSIKFNQNGTTYDVNILKINNGVTEETVWAEKPTVRETPALGIWPNVEQPNFGQQYTHKLAAGWYEVEVKGGGGGGGGGSVYGGESDGLSGGFALRVFRLETDGIATITVGSGGSGGSASRANYNANVAGGGGGGGGGGSSFFLNDICVIGGGGAGGTGTLDYLAPGYGYGGGGGANSDGNSGMSGRSHSGGAGIGGAGGNGGNGGGTYIDGCYNNIQVGGAISPIFIKAIKSDGYGGDINNSNGAAGGKAAVGQTAGEDGYNGSVTIWRLRH